MLNKIFNFLKFIMSFEGVLCLLLTINWFTGGGFTKSGLESDGYAAGRTIIITIIICIVWGIYKLLQRKQNK